MIDGAKTAIAEFAQSNGAYPTTSDLTNLGLNGTPAITGRYATAAVTTGTGVITVTMGAAGTVGANVAGQAITFTPPTLSGVTTTFNFACAAAAMKQKFLPKSCAGQP